MDTAEKDLNSATADIERRQNRAYRVALAYTGEQDMDAAITELLTDLLHLADQYGGSEDHLRCALSRYQAEVSR